ncbi:MAG: alkaline phosphatase D family protein [Pontixanthobacter sp.]
MKTEPPASARLPSLDRRTLFKGSALAIGMAAVPASASAATAPGFAYGVASGEPGADSVLLWTRYGAGRDAVLNWELARDIAFIDIVVGGRVTATSARDFCVKPVATGLAPDSWYYYRFVAANGDVSCIGRTRTLPVGRVDTWRMAVFSCSNIGFGYFNAYAHAAEQNAFDLIVHTGDYFYEYGSATYPSAEVKVAGRDALPLTEAVSLAEYRLRHASYRADPDLRRLTQLYPMIMGWDDHESANDSWAGGAENHDPQTEGPWDARKAAAMRSYREWLPVSDTPYAAYDIGDLARLIRLETRLMNRDEPPDIGAVLQGKGSRAEALAALAAFRDGAYRDPARTMLGMEQETWVADQLRGSTAAGQKWQVLVQQVIMGELAAAPDLVGDIPAGVPPYIRARLMAAAGAAAVGLPLNMDAWDGYPAARSRLLASAQAADANLVVLAGDSHNAWAFALENDGAPAGVEFAGQSVTSPRFEGTLGWVDPAELAKGVVGANAELRWADTARRGYMAVELTPDTATCDYRFTPDVRVRSAAVSDSHRVGVRHGSNTLEG